MINSSLKKQIFVALAVAVITIGIIYVFIAFPLEVKRRDTLLKKVDLYVAAIVTNREEFLSNELYLQHRQSLKILAETISEIEEIVDISIFDSHGNVFFEQHGQDQKKLASRHFKAIIDSGNHRIVMEETWNKLSVMTFIYPLIVIDELQGFFRIRYNISDVLHESRLNFILFITLISTISILLFVILNVQFSRLIIVPVDKLMQAMVKVSKGALGEQVSISSNNEIGKLAEIFNLMSTENARMYNELNAANLELQSVRNYLSNIINSMPSVLVGVDRDCRVTQWNMEAENVTGVVAASAQGRDLSSVFPQMTAQIEEIKESIRTREVRREQKRPCFLKNKNSYEDITIYPLITNGVEGVVIRIDDVTEKVRMEEMMIQSEKMLSVGGLAAGMAHEINNPLAGILQTADVMAIRLGNDKAIPANIEAAELAGTSMDAIAAYMENRGIPRMLKTINVSGRRVADIVINMLSFARKGDSQLSPHSLVDLLEKTLDLATTDYDLKKEYDFKSITLYREYEEDLPLVACEGSKIQQVLLNLLRNGAQAMQMAETENPAFNIRVRCDHRQNMICVEIADNGPGMDRETRRRVFEPFFTTKPAGVGTGLGLSVSYYIITENHGGKMTVESEIGSGTTFSVYLPCNS